MLKLISILMCFILTSCTPQLIEETSTLDCPTKLENIQQQTVSQVMYREDKLPGDDWRKAEDTLKLGYGDCEDLAIVVKYFCEEEDIPAYIAITNGGKHCVCIVKYNSKFRYFSNGNLQAGSWEEVKELLRFLDGYLV